MKKVLLMFAVITLLFGCAAIKEKVIFPAADDVFMTTGDGDIQKPYTPVGQLFYWEEGFRIPGLLIGLIPFKDIDPDVTIKQDIAEEVKRMGGDAVINLRINWKPAKSGFLGMGAFGGSVAVYGTVIKR